VFLYFKKKNPPGGGGGGGGDMVPGTVEGKNMIKTTPARL
jgi:hypothetical protein